MSQIQIKNKVMDGLTIIAIIGACLITGSIIILAVGVYLDHSWILVGLNYVIGPLIVGIIILGLSVKVLDILK